MCVWLCTEYRLLYDRREYKNDAFCVMSMNWIETYLFTVSSFPNVHKIA